MTMENGEALRILTDENCVNSLLTVTQRSRISGFQVPEYEYSIGPARSKTAKQLARFAEHKTRSEPIPAHLRYNERKPTVNRHVYNPIEQEMLSQSRE